MEKEMNKKIMAIIYSNKEKFLLLKTNPKTTKQDTWFVVTGSLKKGESFEDAVRREVREETQLKILKMIPTGYYYEYEWPKNSEKWHHEKTFLVKVQHNKPKITQYEHLDYKWLNKKDFLKLIEWQNNLEKLKLILKEAG